MNEKSVYQPNHYTDGAIEAIEVIEAIIDGIPSREAYCLGNVLKYALRAGRKGDASEDLAKANNYAVRLVTKNWKSLEVEDSTTGKA